MTQYIDRTKQKVKKEKKKTVFTKFCGSENLHESLFIPQDFDYIEYLGKHEHDDIDIFLCRENNNSNIIRIYYGEKGDEFE